jgi:hypothetical protein
VSFSSPQVKCLPTRKYRISKEMYHTPNQTISRLCQTIPFHSTPQIPTPRPSRIPNPIHSAYYQTSTLQFNPYPVFHHWSYTAPRTYRRINKSQGSYVGDFKPHRIKKQTGNVWNHSALGCLRVCAPEINDINQRKYGTCESELELKQKVGIRYLCRVKLDLRKEERLGARN